MRKTRVTLLAVVSATLLAACGSSSAPSGGGGGGGGGGSKALTFVSYGAGAYQDGQQSAWVNPFDKQYNVKTTIASPSDNAQLTEQVQSGNVSWDVVDTDAFFARNECGKLVQPISIGSLASDFPKGSLSRCGVPDAFFGLLLMYNTKTYKTPPTLQDFFNPKFPGKRSIMGSDPTIGPLEAALLAEGTPASKLYPLDVNKALGIWRGIKSKLSDAQTYGAQEQTMLSNQADMALVVSARAYTLLKAGGKFWKPVWTAPTPLSWDVLVIPKGSPHAALAQKFVRYASQPAQAGKFAALAGLGAANTKAKPHYNAQQAEVSYQDHSKQIVVLNGNWWAKNETTVVKAWTAMLTG